LALESLSDYQQLRQIMFYSIITNMQQADIFTQINQIAIYKGFQPFMPACNCIFWVKIDASDVESVD
jgi:hypothetical protein